MMTDPDIIQSVLNGDQNSYTLIVEKYQSNVFRTAIGFVHNKEDAEEITQDVFVKAYQALPSFKGTSAFSTWLYRITVNMAINFLRKKKRRNFWSSLADTFQVASKEKSAAVRLEDSEQNILVENAINALPENQRVAFVLSKYEALPQKEIASVMKITEGAVEQLLIRAKNNLRKKLGGA